MSEVSRPEDEPVGARPPHGGAPEGGRAERVVERGPIALRVQRGGRKLAEVVAREIVHDIASRGLPPNSMLPAESEMLEQYGVGRASLREALRILEVQGFIVLKPGPGGGPMVAAADSRHFGKMTTLYLHLAGATFGDVLQARMVLEPVMVRRAAERAGPQDLERLEAYMEHPEPSPHLLPTQHLRTSTEFHGMVSSMSGNPVLDLFATAIRDIYADRQHGLTYPEHERERVVRDHVAIAERIHDGDAEEAERLMREHMIDFASYSAERFPGMLDEVVDWY